ncbi:adventurous-gliding motility protein Z-like [Dermochelys coriacea]|uniref:adventurous-gliding motility protein Z-like n=1 Tax=Dermochelys coriacea TaxID=27794 RepID=UPI0018E7FC51|nr:adventurous-gliding motility protein Z-like [Dermochelys coriacea]
MGCKLSKKGFCRICKKRKDQQTEGAAEISETHDIAHTSQEASEGTKSQPLTGTRKDIEQATVEAQLMRYDGVPAAPSSQETPADSKETLSVLQTVQGCEAQTTAQSTGKASQDTDAQPAAEMEQEIGEAEFNAKITQDRQPVAQTPRNNEESQHAAEIPEEGIEASKTLLDAEIKQEPEVQTIKQDWQLASCIIEDQPALEAMQEAGKMETTVQTTAEIVEVQPTAENMQEIYQYTGETQPTLQTAQERNVQPMSESEQQTAAQITGRAQAVTQDALNTGEAKPTTQSMQEVPQHPPEAQSALKRLQGAEMQTSAQVMEDVGETQPASETAVLLLVESEQEAGETESAGARTELTESRAHSVTQYRELAALSLQGTVASLSAACTTEVTKRAEPALQTAQEGKAQTTACMARESWTVQGAAEAYPPAEIKEETEAQLVAQGLLETQPTIQSIEAPQGTTKNMQIMEDISMGPAELKASQESPLEPVSIPIKLTIKKPQRTAQVIQEMETLHPAETTELKENQGQQNDLDSQPTSALTEYKERWGNSAIPKEKDQAPELEATEVAKPEQQQQQELPVSHIPESPVEKCQLLDRSMLEACKGKWEEEAENAETPMPSETQGSEDEMALASDSTANSGTAPASEEPQGTEVTDSMSEPYSLCRRTCCT